MVIGSWDWIKREIHDMEAHSPSTHTIIICKYSGSYDQKKAL